VTGPGVDAQQVRPGGRMVAGGEDEIDDVERGGQTVRQLTR
jgi:hypothetical protein